MSNHKNGLDQLKAIARQAMIERGLQPDFPPSALVEVNALSGPGLRSDPPIRDQRDLLWASIDNDDSRDLDQLSVAEAIAGVTSAAPSTCRASSRGPW